MRVYASAEMTLTDTNDGVSVTGIDRYYMASSSSSGITVDSQGWKPDPQETNPISRYHWSYEVVKYSDGAKIPSKPAVIGVYGKEGIDAVTVSLSSEAHTFAGTETRAVASSLSIDISAFKGNQRIPTSIGTVTGAISGQLTHSELGRGTTSNKLVINVTSSLAQGNGTLNIPIIADGKTFNKVFSWSVAFKGKPGDKGDKGDTGDKGVAGTGIKSSEISYVIHTNGTTAPTLGWVSTVPTPKQGRYLWTRTITTYTDNTTSTTYSVAYQATNGQQGDTGAAGNGVSSTTVTYAQTTSGTTTPTSWSSTRPAPIKGQYLWSRTIITYTNGSSSTAYNTSYSATDGQKGDKGDTGPRGPQGPQGIEGPKGANGTPTYTWIRYADTPTSGMSNSPVGKQYIGLSFNNTTQTESSNYNDYQWSLMPQNIEVGGRNYFSNEKSVKFNTNNEYALSNYLNVGSFTQFHNLTVPMGTFVGQEMVLSFECISPNGATPLGVYNTNGNPRYLMNVTGIQSPINNVWKKQVIKVTVTDRGSTYAEAASNKIEFYASEKMGVKIRNVKLEKGNTATDWTPAPEDTQSEIDDTKEQVKKTVKTITEEYYQSTSATSQAGGSWTTKAPTWDANKFMFVRSKVTYVDGTSDYTPTVNLSGAKGDKGADGSSATARNFLLDSKPKTTIHSSEYNIADFILAEEPIHNETYSFTLKGELAANKSNFAIYNTDSSSPLGSLVHKGEGIYTLTFPWIYGGKEQVKIYALYNSEIGASKIEWVTMVKGSVPLTEWVPAHEDIYKYIDDVEIGGRNYAKGTSNEFTYVTVSTYSGSLTEAGATSQRSYTLEELGVQAGDTMTVSMYVGESAEGYGGGLRIDDQHGQNKYSTLKTVKNAYVSETFTILEGTNQISLYTTSYGQSGASRSFELPVRELKLERGNKVTGWSPAPEDVEDKINDKASAEDLTDVSNDLNTSIGDLSNTVDGKVDTSIYEQFLEHNANIQEQLSISTANAQEDITKALARTATVEQKLGEGAADWIFTHTQIRMSDEGITLGEQGSGSYLQITNDQISFYNGSEDPVAFINGGMLNINHAIFVESIQISEFMFSSEISGHLTLRYVGN